MNFCPRLPGRGGGRPFCSPINNNNHKWIGLPKNTLPNLRTFASEPTKETQQKLSQLEFLLTSPKALRAVQAESKPTKAAGRGQGARLSADHIFQKTEDEIRQIEQKEQYKQHIIKMRQEFLETENLVDGGLVSGQIHEEIEKEKPLIKFPDPDALLRTVHDVFDKDNTAKSMKKIRKYKATMNRLFRGRRLGIKKRRQAAREKYGKLERDIQPYSHRLQEGFGNYFPTLFETFPKDHPHFDLVKKLAMEASKNSSFPYSTRYAGIKWMMKSLLTFDQRLKDNPDLDEILESILNSKKEKYEASGMDEEIDVEEPDMIDEEDEKAALVEEDGEGEGETGD